MKKVLKYVLLVLFISLSILFFNQSLVKAETLNHTVTINGQELTSEYKYLVNGVKAENGTLGSDGCTAQFDSIRGILTLNEYNGKGIQGSNLTIKLIGNNKITENNSYQAYGISCNGSTIITSDSNANLTINLNSIESVVAGIIVDYSNNISNDSLTIGGCVNITVNGTSKRNRASGIEANAPINIIDNASFTTKLSGGNFNSGYVQCGIKTNKPLTIDTTGNINLDVSNNVIGNFTYYQYGIYSTSTMLLNNVGTMTIKYPSKNGDVWNSSWTIPETYAINECIDKGIKTKEIHSGSGKVYTLTLESAMNKFGKSSGQYFEGDIINIYAISDVSGLKFKSWSSSVGLIDNSLAEDTTYTMPDCNAIVTANFSPFISQPKFTKISSSSGNIDYTLYEGFSESGRRLVKSGETADDDFSSNHEFLSIPYEINEGTETNQVPAGKYMIAVKHGNNWYYSDIFTVSYDEQIIEDNTTNTNINEIINDNENLKENTTKQNEIIAIDETSNVTEINDTKLPQTGEETNTFARWLTMFIALGIIWLGSMIFIDHEKKKMINK